MCKCPDLAVWCGLTALVVFILCTVINALFHDAPVEYEESYLPKDEL